MTTKKRDPGKQDGQTQKGKESQKRPGDSAMKRDGKRDNKEKPVSEKTKGNRGRPAEKKESDEKK